MPDVVAVKRYASPAPTGADEALVPTWLDPPSVVSPGGGVSATVSVTGTTFGEPEAEPALIVTFAL